ncbi:MULTISPECIES: SIR2 family protein [unclassified Bradyrhizobium]|uniref:P-loop NTPase n=1 Tax=unclassified Bradyrhizobium TaxID=2631580 RepID=UPI001BA6E95B|nr:MULTISPECIES: SIR2 family protein [unclassified Bradyrhizobium]MBR1204383.1 SIR2 family protein [Bradyrhizobium sp. AUGA SZCCT0124]MBR1309731.1 SIR2 family protein [Bradyrhizobium sp. AUGA SZCCT0051]MBR1339872.1 SIR2 family protein [Bradyrhizobium sp. AUGA SZCCT0105]MBR1354479.1 SIR2 family protein [Bradyrhizobium sp. AUGA SZCCT0045]
MQIDDADKQYLLTSMKLGEVILILGAGASASSKNSKGEDVKVGLNLAKVVAERAGMPYNREKLTDVLAATSSVLSRAQLIDLLRREYVGIIPSSELEHLFSYSWRRVYTWNIDDALLNVRRRSVQHRRYYNGLIDKAAELEGLEQLHVVFLHGEITKPEHGFILTETEYATWLKSDKHYWYNRAAQDYLAFCPVFIGSSLQEPILNAELERARREANSNFGRAFLVTPDKLSPIEVGSLRARGITHLRGTLEEFSNWLSVNLPGGRAPKQVVAENNNYSNEALDSLTREDMAAAHFLHHVSNQQLSQALGSMSATAKSTMARQFLRGFPPSWRIASSDIPVQLEACSKLYETLSAAVGANQRLFIVTGQSGSGKTTAVMMTLLRFIHEHQDVDLFELSPDVRSARRAFQLLRKVSDRKTIVYIGDLFLFGDAFREDLDVLSGQDVMVVSTARSGEWRDRLARNLPDIEPFTFQRFGRKDYDPLIDRLIQYVPSPRFRKLSRADQHKKLAESGSQLLIALREATESQNFTDIITDEFENLPDQDTKFLLLIVGLSTMARVGISREGAIEAYGTSAKGRSFEAALAALEGIVDQADNRRLYARHELYVRHIVENIATFAEFSAVIKSILRTYLKYNIPIVRSVNRLDSQLFKFLLNHDFIFVHADRHGDRASGQEIYAEFEVEFQLDGHFWLQYGLYLAEINDLTGAIDKLRMSVKAYPDNPYVVHALADVQLRVAKNRAAYDTLTRVLIDEAVKALKLQDASAIESDIYPIVTLANGHISALLRHKQTAAARNVASQYFDRLQQLEKRLASPSLTTMKEKVFRFVTLNEWHDRPMHVKKRSDLGKYDA